MENANELNIVEAMSPAGAIKWWQSQNPAGLVFQSVRDLLAGMKKRQARKLAWKCVRRDSDISLHELGGLWAARRENRRWYGTRSVRSAMLPLAFLFWMRRLRRMTHERLERENDLWALKQLWMENAYFHQGWDYAELVLRRIATVYALCSDDREKAAFRRRVVEFHERSHTGCESLYRIVQLA